MIKIAIVGATGYTGCELLRILLQHPFAEVAVITSRSQAGGAASKIFPQLSGLTDLKFSEPDDQQVANCDLVFFATPNGTAMRFAPELLKAGARIIDMSADFRLTNAQTWSEWYEMTHACPELLKEAVYGLPEINRAKIQSAQLIANPGCYPTAVILGFLPLLEAGLIDTKQMIADCKSGTSGAGRNANVATLLSECGESISAYKISGHRHLPEIKQILGRIAGDEPPLTFVPHLIPMIRGILSTLYADLTKQGVDVQRLYEERYQDEPFIQVLPVGASPQTRHVRGSNRCQIAVHNPQQGKRLVVLSAIDNLVKGAAGQAVQNMNLMYGFEETGGLNALALSP